MNEFSMILRDALLSDGYRIRVGVRMLDEGLAKKDFIKTMSDRLRDEVGEWYEYDSDETCTSDKLVSAMLRRIDFEEIAAIIYIEASEAKAELDARREKVTVEYEKMIFDDPEKALAVVKRAEEYKGDVDRVAEALEADEYYRLLNAKGIKDKHTTEGVEVLQRSRFINYRPTAEKACYAYNANHQEAQEEETA